VKLSVLAQGKLKDHALRQLTDDYKSRLQRYVGLEEIEVKDTQALLRRVPRESFIVMLEVWGEALSSPALASKLEAWATRNKGNVCFVIGGADGIPKELSKLGDAHLSLSRLTLPHRLVRLLLFEQLYRCMTLLRGEPYARE
jgi:23S rRNA (pseudouridine1915-N3)-methyltransferase